MLKKELFEVKEVRGIKRAFYGKNTKWTKVSNKYMIEVLKAYEPVEPELPGGGA